jgi:putative SOS response-associated peptidase YedK
MCGRFARTTPFRTIIEQFQIQENLINDLEPSSNIFPSEEVEAIIFDEQKKKLVKLKWGLVPAWLKEPQKGQINAKAETINQKPFFKESFQKRRTLIITDGFYEWKKEGREKIPIHIRMKNGEPFALAGVYDFWKTSDGRQIDTCAIITTEANDLLKSIHDRMPVIIKKKDIGLWLDCAQDENLVLSLLKPIESEALELIPGKFNEKEFIPSPQQNKKKSN